MPSRFTYSRWDGTQRVVSDDPDWAFSQLADDLAYHGDVSAALRRLLQDGFRGPDGNRLPGLNEVLERLRAERARRLAASPLGAWYDDIVAELADIVDDERHHLDRSVADAERGTDEDSAAAVRAAAEQRHAHLDLLPGDLAGTMRELGSYHFESADAARRFGELSDRLRSRLVQQQFEQLSTGMQSVTAADVAALNEMLADLNALVSAHGRGEDTTERFATFMNKHGHHIPGQPTTVEELLEALARQMAAAQALMNSMTPEQRAELQQLAHDMLGDLDLGWQIDQLGANLAELFPNLNWNDAYQFPQPSAGQQPIGYSAALRSAADLGALDELADLLQRVASPAQLGEVDIDQVRGLLDDQTADALEQLSALDRQLREAGLVGRSDGRLTLTPAGIRALGRQALRDVFSSLDRAQLGQHRMHEPGWGHERTYQTKPYEFGDPFRLDLEQTLRNAVRRNGGGTPIRLAPDDFEIDQTEHLTRAATVLMLDLSMSMPMRDNFLPAKRVALALHHLISTQFPHDYLGVIGFGATARPVEPYQLPEVTFDLAYGTNMHYGLRLARRMLSTQNGSKQIIMITDGEPTAHNLPDGQVFFDYPPSPDTVAATLGEVLACTRAGIRINTFVLDATAALTRFVEQLTRINKGRAFYPSNDELGGYVLVDFLAHRRSTSRRVAS